MTAPPAPAAGHRRGISCGSLACHRHPRVLAGSPRVGWYTRGVARFGLSEPNARAFVIGWLRPGPPRCNRPAPRSPGHPSAALPPGRGGQRGLKAAGSRSPPQCPHTTRRPGAVPRHLPGGRLRPGAAAPRGPRPPQLPPRRGPASPGASTMSRRFPPRRPPRESPRAPGPLLRGAPLARPGPLRPRPAYCCGGREGAALPPADLPGPGPYAAAYK
ncbi:basic proline-rich protein-like [Harpia harpyja]|uniref:basic proline-rich protein-like n=1 Tax=Harpia harpyja TaxID=202280 RepID=UPI0022B177E2|nr:basic proline-rich protein-like [Harpia harpyja]